MAKKRVSGPNQSPNIHDVAARAGVAISSISRVLSGHPDVSESMRLKVEKAAAELGYEPDFLAQSLRRGATKTVGFIIRDISNPFFGVIAQYCEKELRKFGYSMFLMISDEDIQTEAENITLLRRRRVDGLIASLVSEDAPNLKESLEKLECPVVLLDRELPGFPASAVIGNHHQGVQDAVADLINRGHTRIAFISGSTKVYTTRDRLKGFKAAFKAAGLPVPNDLIALNKFDADYGQWETLRMFSLASPPTALITGSVGSTSGALRALKSLKLTPGKNIALVAIDEWPMFDVYGGELSSVYRNPEVIGREAAKVLLETLAGGKARKVVVDTKYIARGTSSGGLAKKRG